GAAIPATLGAAADRALAALARIAPPGAFAGLRGAQLLTERAAITGTTQNRSCRLLEARGGWLALNLPREDDWSLVPAWLEAEASHWEAIATVVRGRDALELVERGREIGLAVALSTSHRRKPVPSAFLQT